MTRRDLLGMAVNTFVLAVGVLFLVLVCMHLTSCGAIVPGSTGTSGGGSPGDVVSPEVAQEGCVAACVAFDFAQCTGEVKRSLPVGEIVSAAQEQVDELLEAVQELTLAQAECAVKCQDLVLTHNDMVDRVDLDCLMGLSPGSACADVAACLGVD